MRRVLSTIVTPGLSRGPSPSASAYEAGGAKRSGAAVMLPTRTHAPGDGAGDGPRDEPGATDNLPKTPHTRAPGRAGTPGRRSWPTPPGGVLKTATSGARSVHQYGIRTVRAPRTMRKRAIWSER